MHDHEHELEYDDDDCGCGEEIPDARRQKVPGVQFCVACQARREKRGNR